MKSVADIILGAYHQGIVIPAFNVPYLPMIEPVIRAVVDQGRKFIALLSVEHFRKAVHQERLLMEILNGDDDRRAAAFFRERFGSTIDRHIQTSDRVQNVLLNRALWEAATGPGFVAVLGTAGELVGITSRLKIIDGCLDQLKV